MLYYLKRPSISDSSSPSYKWTQQRWWDVWFKGMINLKVIVPVSLWLKLSGYESYPRMTSDFCRNTSFCITHSSHSIFTATLYSLAWHHPPSTSPILKAVLNEDSCSPESLDSCVLFMSSDWKEVASIYSKRVIFESWWVEWCEFYSQTCAARFLVHGCGESSVIVRYYLFQEI